MFPSKNRMYVVIVDLPNRVAETIVVFDNAEMFGLDRFVERL